MKKRYIILISLCTLALGVFTGWAVTVEYSAHTLSDAAPVDVRENSPDYHFINPLLFSKTKKSLYADEYKDLNQSLNSYISKVMDTNTATSVSVYFRNLNTGHWTGINEDQTYEPGSMMKVAVLLSYLKDAEQDSGVLSKSIQYKGADISGQHYMPNTAIPVGKYSVSQLIGRMIRYSDNGAMAALVNDNINGFRDVYKEFRLPVPVESGISSDYMSARSYSVMFRTLYNSTYLPWNVSEQALLLLSTTNFVQGIVAGVPEGTVVAHKFGEHTSLDASGNEIDHELHDCGIVYYPENPYLVCIMTKGDSFVKLESVISGISALVYGYVHSNI